MAGGQGGGAQSVKDRAAPAVPRLTLDPLPARLMVCRLPPDAAIPAWAGGSFCALTRTAEELSVVCAEADAPGALRMEPGWRALKVRGPLPFAATGILAALAAPLAAAAIPIFAISTFDTDYLLVREGALPAALSLLRAAGHHCDDGAGPAAGAERVGAR